MGIGQVLRGTCDFCGDEFYMVKLTRRNGDQYCEHCLKHHAPPCEDDNEICPDCNGSGEGRYEGTTCWHCNGKGVI